MDLEVNILKKEIRKMDLAVNIQKKELRKMDLEVNILKKELIEQMKDGFRGQHPEEGAYRVNKRLIKRYRGEHFVGKIYFIGSTLQETWNF